MDEQIQSAPFPAHSDGERFYNPGAAAPRGWLDVFRWKLTSRPDRSPRFVSDVVPSTPPGQVDGRDLRVTLVNHATVLLQHAGWNILTDPMWSQRASPIAWAGPHRRRAPGVRLDDLPRLDAVLLSHNHYDHLDLPSLTWLAKRRAPTFVVPAGVGKLLTSASIGPVHEIDWGETHRLAGTWVSAVPAVHFSARGLLDRNRTLWCGYAIQAEGGVVYFAGDTAFGPHFAQIRERFGAPRLALLPIGAYAPRWFMAQVHMAPDEAIRAHGVLGAHTTVAIHHGTFQLADDGLDEAPRVLMAQSPPQSFRVLRNGESLVVG
jgi:L-ascorbate metabolism protein UlaG (beta-lactamase superfamily)